MKSRAPKLTGVDIRLKDMDRMGIDIQAVCPAPYHFFYFTEPDYGAELAREVNEGIAEDRGRYARPLRRPRLGAAAERGPGRARTRLRGEEPGPARRRDLHQRQRQEPHRSRAGAGEVLRALRGTGHRDLHASAGLHAGRPAHAPLLQQRDRQSAGVDGGGVAPDLRRRDGAPSQAEDRGGARRRLRRALLGAHGPRVARAARLPHGDQAAALEATWRSSTSTASPSTR